MKRRLVALALLGLPAAAAAQEKAPRFCPSRPSLENSACTTEPGHAHLEVSFADWQLDNDKSERDDTVLIGDALLRVGVGPTTEVQVGWSPYGHVRQRDKASGEIERFGRVGDVTLAVRQNLRNPDGKGLSYGVQPFVTLPVGRKPVGAGDWGAGLIAPITYDLNDMVNVGATGEVDAAVDQDGHGRHVAFSGIAALSLSLSDAVSTTIETELLRDDDPSGATTQALGGLGLTWKVAKTRALYAEAVGGLNRAAPDVRLYAGLVTLF